MNNQLVEKSELHVDGLLDIVDVFDTIQGEGPYAGTPAIFIRLAGCNLSATCKGCDTDYTTGRHLMDVGGVMKEMRKFKMRRLIVITGGEPFRQNIVPLCTELLKHGHKVQIETNGTLWIPGTPSTVHITCSPKSPTINKQLRLRVKSWKYILEEGRVDPNDGLPTSSLGGPTPPARPFASEKVDNIFVQPFDCKDEARNKMNLEAAVQSCLEHGYRLSVQLHKLANLP